MKAPDRNLPFALVDDLEQPVLDADEHHHLARVRRLRPGDPLTAGDGAGRWRPVSFGEPLEPTGPIESVARAEPAITVAFAIVKGDRTELIVQKLTEVGVDGIVPFVAARSVARWDDAKAERHHARLVAIARSAAAQSHRPWLPEVLAPVRFAAAAGLAGAALADPEGAAPSLDTPTLLIGPEGGWTPDELAANPRRVALAGHVLRSETAAIVAGSLLCALRAGLVGPTT